MADNLRNNKEVPWARSQADSLLQSMREYTNGAINGVKLETFSEGYNSGFGEVVVAKDNYLYDFIIHDGNGEVSDFQEGMLDKILSTFKFLP